MATSNLGFGQKCSFCWKSNFLVALAAFWVNFCLLGVLRSNAVIYSALVDVFGINRQYAAWPSGIFGFFMSITGALTGILTNYWSIRSLTIFGTILASISVSLCSLACQMEHIILLYGALQGIGIGFVVPLTHVVLNQNFSKYRAFALGIAYSGSSAGSFIFPPVSLYLLQVYDLDGTFLLLGGIMLNALLGSILFKTPKQLQSQKINCDKTSPYCQSRVVFQYEEKVYPESNAIVIRKCDKKEIDVVKCDTKSKVSENECGIQSPEKTGFFRIYRNFRKRQNVLSAVEILTSPYFLLISFAYASYFTSSAIFLMTILDFVEDRGVKGDEGVFLVSAYSFGDLTGRLTTGWIADLQIVRRSTLVRLYLIIMGIMLIIFSWLPTSGMPAVSVALGVISGGLIVNHSVLFNEYLGLQKLPMAMGFATCIVGMSAFLRPIIIGYFRDYHQSYELLFVFLGFLQIFIALVWFLELIIPVVRKRWFVNRNAQ